MDLGFRSYSCRLGSSYPNKVVKSRNKNSLCLIVSLSIEFAFLRSSSHFQAFLQCLRAIEEDNPLLPTTIDYTLVSSFCSSLARSHIMMHDTHSLRSFVKYCFHHSKTIFISSRHRVISSLYIYNSR